ELIYLSGAGAALTGTDNMGVKALSRALETIWGKKPYFPREGGSIGVVVKLHAKPINGRAHPSEPRRWQPP
ncbi:MAG: hypothetical protein ACXVCX_09455, partial [Ktedonobacterales bacterium]